jgi:lysophospholipase L1-like esterase
MARKKKARKKTARRRAATPRSTVSLRVARQAGEAMAKKALSRRKARRAAAARPRGARAALAAAAAAPPGLLVAEGDSWFDYPFSDVLQELEDLRYDVEDVAHRGDTVEDMAYAEDQFAALLRRLHKIKDRGQTPKAVLISGGGNDIAGQEFSVLLNHARSGLPAINDRIVSGLFEDRLRFAIASLVGAVTHFSQQIFRKKLPIFLHGYDYPVPDGRGVLGGAWFLPGPWLEPGFRRKGYDTVPVRMPIMSMLIDRFNDVVSSIAGSSGFAHVHYVDLRRTLKTTLANDVYKQWWGNELHPTGKGFEAVAQRFHQEIQAHA